MVFDFRGVRRRPFYLSAAALESCFLRGRRPTIMWLLASASQALTVVSVSPGHVTFPATSANQLTYLSRATSSPADQILARSYDAHKWEALQPEILAVSCVNAVCSGTVPNDGIQYRLTTISVPSPLAANKRARAHGHQEH